MIYKRSFCKPYFHTDLLLNSVSFTSLYACCQFLPTFFQFRKFALFLVHLCCWGVLGGGGGNNNQVSQIRANHDTISQGALFCSGHILDYIVLHIAKGWLEITGVQSEWPIKPLYPMPIWSGWEIENIRNIAPPNQRFLSSSASFQHHHTPSMVKYDIWPPDNMYI